MRSSWLLSVCGSDFEGNVILARFLILFLTKFLDAKPLVQ